MLTPTPAFATLKVVSIVVNLERGPVKIVSTYMTPTRNLEACDFSRIFDSRIPVVIAGNLKTKHPS